MVTRQHLIQYINQYLEVDLFKDYAPNGLQVEGIERIKTIVTGVTACQALIEQAIIHQAQAILVHHGYFWKGETPVITGVKKNRLGLLLKNDINLLAYHLPLDCHPLIGNNAKMADILDFKKVQSQKIGPNKNLLWHGELQQPMAANDFLIFCSSRLSPNTIHLPAASDKAIKRVAWCSGGAQDYIEHAASLGVDAYLSGEASERTTHQACEMDIHYFACGHHATERAGIKALGEHLSEHFDLNHHFIDIINPI